MTNEEILKLVYVVSHATEQNAPTLFDATNMFRPVPITIKNSLNEKHFDLLTASAAMYQRLFNATSVLEALSTEIEQSTIKEKQMLLKLIDTETALCLMTMRIATHGAEQVVKEATAEQNAKFGKNS